ncbi:MAG: AzlD domain-containing protein [Cypionkella sp.]
MRAEVLELALIAGVLTYLWRYLPLRANLSDMTPGGILARFLAATGPAAIATLFVAEMMPLLHATLPQQGRIGVGVITVLLAYYWRRSVVFATLAGAVACGGAAALGLS